jgi:hypothetical protein
LYGGSKECRGNFEEVDALKRFKKRMNWRSIAATRPKPHINRNVDTETAVWKEWNGHCTENKSILFTKVQWNARALTEISFT